MVHRLRASKEGYARACDRPVLRRLADLRSSSRLLAGVVQEARSQDSMPFKLSIARQGGL